MKANLCLLILLSAYNTLYAQTKMGVQPLSAGIEQRKALLIGNRNYTHFRPLANTERDVDAMTSLLRKLNFTVIVYKDLDYKGTVQAIANFKASLRPDDIALVYYSGHGIGSGGQSYLLPVESDIQCTSELEAYGPLSLNALVTGLAVRQVRNSFVFLDACRNLPISNCDRTKGKDEVRGLVFPKNNPKGNLIVFATGEGETADDDKYDKTNSLFTAELLKHLGTPNLGIREIMDKVIEGVETRSGGRQVPQKLEDLRGNFVFTITNIPKYGTADSILKKPKLQEVRSSTPPHSAKFLNLSFADMTLVKGGKFRRTEGDVYTIENGVVKMSGKAVYKEVNVSSFWMGKYEVTQRQWKTIMGTNPSHFNDCLDCPVEQVSWEDVQIFLNKLNLVTNGNYRLPTEAEWEYAAGGGAEPGRKPYGNGQVTLDAIHANFDARTYYGKGLFRAKTTQVGSFEPNRLKLYDMSGNVWEWCQDWYNEGYYTISPISDPPSPSKGQKRVIRGGSWGIRYDYCDISWRGAAYPHKSDKYMGFRIASSAQ